MGKQNDHTQRVTGQGAVKKEGSALPDEWEPPVIFTESFTGRMDIMNPLGMTQSL